MCDEHEVMIGRTMTLGRARELSDRSYFYQMLRDNPAIRGVTAGGEDEVLVGAIDHHIHAYPDFVNRSQDMLEIAVEASRAGMRALAFKDHWNLTATSAYLVQAQIDRLVLDGVLEHRVEIYGGLGLNLGVNPEAVRIGLQYPNFRCIWFPTFKSYGWARFAGMNPTEDEYVRMVDPSGEILPNVREVIDMAAEHNVAIGLGHTDFEELLPLATYANEVGAKTVLDHPLLELNKLLIDEMATLADLGTYVGVYCQPMIPSLYQPVQDPMETVNVIERIGADRCIAASDFGQVLHMDALDGVRVYIRALQGFGVSNEEIRTMLCDNPADLLGLAAAS